MRVMQSKEEKINDVKPYENKMDILFKELYDKIYNSEFFTRDQLPSKPGIYVFFDNEGKAIYVGRTNNLRSRIQYHTRRGSQSGSATFAFNCAKKEFEKIHEKTYKTRTELEKDNDFQTLYYEEKAKLYSSKIKYLVIENDVIQTMLEPYLACKFETYPYFQTFDNH